MARVLVVDDDPAIVEVLAYGLELEGFTVWTASHLEAARDLLHAGAVDLIVTDLLTTPFAPTPLAPLAELAQAAPMTPILLVSGYPEVGLLAQGAAGLAGILAKPFEIADFLAAVQAALAAPGEPFNPGWRSPAAPAPGRGLIANSA